MKKIYLIIWSLAILYACETKRDNHETENKALNIRGTWKLISGVTIQSGDTTFTDYTKDQETIKIINKSHFAFFTHDLKQGQDSTATFVSGGGTYSLNGNQYTEHLEYCNYREWEGNKFDFELSMHGDTLTQTGIEKIEEIDVDRKIIETYIKMSN